MLNFFILFLFFNCYSYHSLLDFNPKISHWLSTLNPIFSDQQMREKLLNPAFSIDETSKYLSAMIINIHILPLYFEAMIEQHGLIFLGLEFENINLEEMNIENIVLYLLNNLSDMERFILSRHEIDRSKTIKSIEFLKLIARDGYTKKSFGKFHLNHPQYPHYYYPLQAAYDMLGQLYSDKNKSRYLKKLLLDNLSEEERTLLLNDANG